MSTDMAAAQAKLADLSAPDSDFETSSPKHVSIKKTRVSKRLHRMETALRSFLILKNLTPEQVDRFMDSYVIYDLDWKDEKMMTETLGPDYQKKVGECLRDYYSVLNHMCAIGELEKMYVPPIMDMSASIFDNQILYEELIAEELELPPDARVLDLGCGRGRVAAHMSRMTGAHVTGLNIDFDQVASAIAFNQEEKLTNDFVRADFNDLPLPFGDQEFDGFYQIQAFSLCKDIPKLCKELHRVLKPGAKLSLLDWASLEAFNPEDPHHKELMRCIKPLIGAVGTPTPQSLCADLESAGFHVLQSRNASIDGLQAPLIESAKYYFRAAKVTVLGLVRIGLLPQHFKTLFNRFTKDSDAFIEADRDRLITTCYHWVAEKPRDNETPSNGAVAEPKSETTLPEDAVVSQETADNAHVAGPAGHENGKTESPASSDRATPSSNSSSDGLKSPSPADSQSTGITVPPTEPPVAEKVEQPQPTSAEAAVPQAQS